MFCVLAFGDIGDNQLMKSIIDHRNRRCSAIDNRLSAIIATSLSTMDLKFGRNFVSLYKYIVAKSNFNSHMRLF